MTLAFPLAPEPEEAAREAGRLLFAGPVTFKNASNLQEVAKNLPMDKLLIETDSPYLAPVPFRGKMNEPGYVAHVGEFIANLKGVSLREVAFQTSENFFNLFQTAKA